MHPVDDMMQVIEHGGFEPVSSQSTLMWSADVFYLQDVIQAMRCERSGTAEETACIAWDIPGDECLWETCCCRSVEA